MLKIYERFVFVDKCLGGKFPAKTNSIRIKKTMKKYKCMPCGYIYDPAEGDPDNGVPAGTPFEELPEDWVCPVCGMGKEEFEPVED